MEINKIPQGFALCMQSNCPMASTCTRQVVFNNISSKVPKFTLLNPNSIVLSQDGCPNYHPHHIVRIAFGFTNLYSHLPVKNADLFFTTLPGIKSESTYYRMKRGAHPISPAIQQQILASAHSLGAPEDIGFDRYEDEIQW